MNSLVALMKGGILIINRCKTINTCLVAIAIYLGLTVHAQAVTLTFEDGLLGNSAETFYQASYGITFSGGGLLSEGSEGGMAGQPQFVSYTSGYQIGTVLKDSSGNYSDSFFDIWIKFSEDVYSVSGDYLGNLQYGGSVYAYDDSGGLLDTNYISASSSSRTNQVGTLGTFDFESTTAISMIHMISDQNTAMVILDNLTFSTSPAPVPEPATLLLLGVGLIGVMGSRKKFKK